MLFPPNDAIAYENALGTYFSSLCDPKTQNQQINLNINKP